MLRLGRKGPEVDLVHSSNLNKQEQVDKTWRERERERGLLLVSIGFRGRNIDCLAAALGPLACLAAAIGTLAWLT